MRRLSGQLIGHSGYDWVTEPSQQSMDDWEAEIQAELQSISADITNTRWQRAFEKCEKMLDRLKSEGRARNENPEWELWTCFETLVQEMHESKALEDDDDFIELHKEVMYG